jgi:prepilin-type N-terminal cleavage/methylation domain-containing protein
MKTTIHKKIGFTLIEMMMVLVIISTIVVMIANYTLVKTEQIRRETAAIQIQQILNAGLAYYINYATWPSSLSQLQGSYIPTNLHSPYPAQYSVTNNATTGVLTVTLIVENSTDAKILAGMVPLGTSGGTGGLSVYAQVNIPGQNLNNARSGNFAGVYHPGGCVPVPTCPGTMVAEIFLAADQIMGTYDASPTGSTPNVYPITNFTAYATGPSTANPPTPPDCITGAPVACDSTTSTVITAAGAGFWRICASIGTQAGNISTQTNSGSNSWAQWQTIMALTRCSPPAEQPGSNLKVWLP